MQRILNAIANTAIPVSQPLFLVRNLILIGASIITIYAGSLEPRSITSAMLIGGGCAVLYMVAKGK